MNDEHKTHDAQVFSQMDNADQVNARENKNGAAATTTATPDDEHLDNIMFSENVDKDSASYRLYHMSLQEWEGMSTDQKKLLLESLTDQEKTDIRKFSKFEVTDLASMPLEKAKAAYFTSVSQGSFTRLTNKMADPNGVAKIAADTISRSFVALADFEPLREAAEPTGEELKMLREQLAALSKQFQKVLKELTAPETIRRMAAEQAFEAEARELQPYIKKELEKPEYNGRDFESIMGNYDPLEPAEAAQDPTTELYRLMTAARKMAAENINVTVKKTKTQKYPVDKYNRMFWNGIIDGNTKSGFDMKPPMGAIVMYRVNFDDLPDNVNFSKDITPFDKQVYTTAGSILWAGNQITTITQIYYQMGYRGKPAKKTLERIHESIEKMRFTHLWIDNDEETGKLKKRTHYHYDGYLLPAEIVTATVNGKLTDEAIHFLKTDLPLMAFAAERGEITTITQELRQLPISMTEKNLALHDELYTRLSIEKNRKKKDKQCRMLLDTIYENMGLTADQKVQRSRVKKNIIALLDHYKNNQFISRYVFEKDGITIYWK